MVLEQASSLPALQKSDINSILAWRRMLQMRAEAGHPYDELSTAQVELFNRLAPTFVGTADELLLCVQAITPQGESPAPLAAP